MAGRTARMIPLHAEEIAGRRGHIAARRQCDATQQVKGDPDAPRVVVVQVGHRAKAEAEAADGDQQPDGKDHSRDQVAGRAGDGTTASCQTQPCIQGLAAMTSATASRRFERYLPEFHCLTPPRRWCRACPSCPFQAWKAWRQPWQRLLRRPSRQPLPQPSPRPSAFSASSCARRALFGFATAFYHFISDGAILFPWRLPFAALSEAGLQLLRGFFLGTGDGGVLRHRSALPWRSVPYAW